MKKITFMLFLLSGCAGDGSSAPRVPADRPATAKEAIGSQLALELFYAPATVPQPFWTEWRGHGLAVLAGPEAGLPRLLAEVSLEQGFGELMSCLPNAGKAEWSLGDDGSFSLDLPSEEGSASLSLSGTLVMHHYLVPGDEPRQIPTLRSELRATGSWTVAVGSACEPDDFSGGLTGQFEARQVQPEAADYQPMAGPRGTLLLIDPSGALHARVRGPSGVLLEMARSAQ